MNRRPFLKKTALASTLLIPSFPQAISTQKKKQKRIKPPRLKEGDTVTLITPGSYASDELVENAVKNMEGFGFKVKLSKNLRAQRGFTAGTDQQRLDDLHEAFADKETNFICCVRGGYGCSRLLPYLDYKLIRSNPKALMGFSDITALLQAIYSKTGLIGFHGPVAAWDFTERNTEDFVKLLFEGKEDHLIEGKEAAEIYKSGKAKGRLVGGNLSLLAAMAGTPFGMDATNNIVFIEDVGEKPYRIDRMLTQLRQASNLHKAKGILLGEFLNCEAKEGDLSLSLKDTLMDRLGDLGIPILYNFPFGHDVNMCTLPVGVKVEMDADAKKVSFKESAVV